LHPHPCPIADQDGTVAAALFECSALHSGVPAEYVAGDATTKRPSANAAARSRAIASGTAIPHPPAMSMLREN